MILLGSTVSLLRKFRINCRFIERSVASSFDDWAKLAIAIPEIKINDNKCFIKNFLKDEITCVLNG